jgi:UDP-N-acetylmuramate dehydrogenase
VEIRGQVPLAPLTTLELGGPARWLVTARDEATVFEALRWARDRSLEVACLAGGSNVVVADQGFDGLVVHLALQGIEQRTEGDRVLVTAAAGEPWDPLVAQVVRAGLAGVECLSGVPGSVGATPVQNVGAYGQEVAETLRQVRALDRSTLEVETLEPAVCGFGYRTSRFRRHPDRHLVLSVTLALRPGGEPTLRYPELVRALTGTRPGLVETREAVLRLRRAKSMVIDPGDPNRRSVGSFFVNPVVDDEVAQRVAITALDTGSARAPEEVPRFPVEGGVKLSAGWLVEQSGLPRGTRRGAVGLSSRHALALVHHGGGTTAELVALAREVQQRVADRFGVTLHPEPVFLGFPTPPLV